MKKIRRNLTVFLFLLSMLALPFQAVVSSEPAEESHELMILFDVSTSMSWNDTSFLAPDALRQIVHTLPVHWHVGIVTFNGAVVDYVAPGAHTRDEVQAVLNRARYTNWTNSGAGFAQVLELFSSNAQNRKIVFMTDGELAHLPTAQETAEATAHGERMIAEIIASDIVVHTIAVGQDFPEVHESVMDLAPATGGTLLLAPTSRELSAVAAELVMDAFAPTQSQVGAAQMQDATSGRFVIELPQDGLDYAKILIHAETAISQVVVNASASNIHIENGARFVLVEIIAPTERTIQIDFLAEGTSTANLILPGNATSAEVGTDNNQGPIVPDESADVLPDDRAEGSEGTATTDIDAVSEQSDQVRANIARQNFAISTLVVLTFFILFLLLFHIRVREKTAAKPLVAERVLTEKTVQRSTMQEGSVAGAAQGQTVSEEPAQSVYEFTGKLDVYVTPQSSGMQQTYVARLRKKGQYSLRDVLQKCRVSGVFLGAERMYLSTDKYGALQITNESGYVIFVKSKALKKGESHILEYGENVRVNLEDGVLVISPRLLYRAHREER